MKKNVLFILVVAGYILSTVLSGCTTVKEMGKGFMGVSTQVLYQKRKDALKKSFALDYDGCYVKVKEILSQKNKEAYIYAQDYKERLIAIYLTPADTTPVGIFFSDEPGGHTLIEISSPSTYAKEEIANRIFTGIDELIKPKIGEKKADVEEKTSH
jgi:predicted small secreted protein